MPSCEKCGKTKGTEKLSVTIPTGHNLPKAPAATRQNQNKLLLQSPKKATRNKQS